MGEADYSRYIKKISDIHSKSMRAFLWRDASHLKKELGLFHYSVVYSAVENLLDKRERGSRLKGGFFDEEIEGLVKVCKEVSLKHQKAMAEDVRQKGYEYIKLIPDWNPSLSQPPIETYLLTFLGFTYYFKGDETDSLRTKNGKTDPTFDFINPRIILPDNKIIYTPPQKAPL